MKQGTQVGQLMQAIIAILIAGGALFWFLTEERKPAGHENLKIEVSDLRSNLSEALQLIGQAAAGRLTANYFHIETEMLGDNLDNLARDLGAAKVEPGLEEKLADGRALTDHAAGELKRLRASFHNQPAMQETKAKLTEIFGRALALEKSLI